MGVEGEPLESDHLTVQCMKHLIFNNLDLPDEYVPNKMYPPFSRVIGIWNIPRYSPRIHWWFDSQFVDRIPIG